MDRYQSKSLCTLHQHCSSHCRNKWYFANFLDNSWGNRWYWYDLKNWVKQKDADGNTIRDEEGEAYFKGNYSVATGTVLTINTKEKKLYNGDRELKDISASLTPQKMEFIKAGGSYAIVFGKKLQTFASKVLDTDVTPVFATSKEDFS